MKLTPNFMVSFETNIQGITVSNWERAIAGLQWDRVMKVRPLTTKVNLLTWLLETGRLYPEGNGGNTRFDDMVAAQTEIIADNVGTGLMLTKNEIEDNAMRDNPRVSVLDYATKWASDTGAAAAYFPQSQLIYLIQNGKTLTGYDNVPFFSNAHPLNVVTGAAGGTYSNIVSAVPINAPAATGQTEFDALIVAQRNFAKARAAVTSQKFLNGIPRRLRVTAMIVPTALEYRALQLVKSATISGSDNAIARMGDVEVIVMSELDSEPDVYYLAVGDTLSDELGAFIYGERDPFEMTMYSPIEQVELKRADKFEWFMKGRNGVAYGHPYLFYRCEPT